MSDLTFGPSSKVKRWFTGLLLVIEVLGGKPAHIEEIMCWESFGVVRFEFGPLLQGQMRIAKLKSAYNSLIIGPRGLGW